MFFNSISNGVDVIAKLTELDASFLLVILGLSALVLGVMALYVAILALKR